MSDLDAYRSQIDDIDADIIRLLGERFTITRKVGTYKAQHKLDVKDRQREAKQKETAHTLSLENNLNPELIFAIQKLVIDEVLKEHQALKEVA